MQKPVAQAKRLAAPYPTWRRFFWKCDEEEPPHLTYRVFAWARIGMAYPFIIIPALLASDRFILEAPDPALASVLLKVWHAAHVLYAVAAVVALVGSSKRFAPQAIGAARMATLGCAILEVITTMLFSMLLGLDRAMPHLIPLALLVTYRISMPIRFGLAVLFTTALSFLTVAACFVSFPDQTANLIRNPDLMQMHAHDLQAGLLTMVALPFMLFCALNFIVNQRNILQCYLTRTVLSRYLPPQLVAQASLRAFEFEHAPERRTMTVLFVDLVGFTRLSQELGSERVASIVNRFLNEVSSCAFHHGGTVDKFIGDCVMIFFGAPDDMPPQEQAVRCTNMAKRLQQTMQEIDWGCH